MEIRAGYEIIYDCPQPTPMLLMLRIHPSRTADLRTPDRIAFDPPIASTEYRDGFGNLCTRIVAPEGRLAIANDFVRRRFRATRCQRTGRRAASGRRAAR